MAKIGVDGVDGVVAVLVGHKMIGDPGMQVAPVAVMTHNSPLNKTRMTLKKTRVMKIWSGMVGG